MLVPALRGRVDLWQDTNSDQHGSYSFEHLARGEYKVFAWRDVEPGMWFDAEFLKDVEAKGHETMAAPVVDPM